MASTSRRTASAKRGKLIVFEGLDGAGKSTQLALLKEKLTKEGYKVKEVSWRSEGMVGSYIRRLQREEVPLSSVAFSALHAADLADMVANVIEPALKKGKVVLMDRYLYTQIARDEALGIDPAWTERLFAFAPAPDLVVYMDIPAETSLERVQKRLLSGARKRDLEGTNAPSFNQPYQPNGEPMTELFRRTQLRQFQTLVARSYERQMRAPAAIRLDATRKLKKVEQEIRDLVLSHLA